MPRSASTLTLSERREAASDLFLKGFTVADVAKKLDITWDTAKSYKRWHEKRITEQARANPQLLSDVLKNTVAMLAELDQVKAAAWRTYHGKGVGAQTRLQALNTIRQAQNDKAKLYGLFGVKQDFYTLVANVKLVQDRVLDFLARELCSEDRTKLERFLMSPELQQYMQTPSLALPMGDDDVIDAEILEEEDVPA